MYLIQRVQYHEIDEYQVFTQQIITLKHALKQMAIINLTNIDIIYTFVHLRNVSQTITTVDCNSFKVR